MSIIDSLTGFVKAATRLIGMVWPRHDDKALTRAHFGVNSNGQMMCLYCKKPEPWPVGERCPMFR